MEKINKIILFIFIFFAPIFIKNKNYNRIVFTLNGTKFSSNSSILFEYLIKNTVYEVKYIINNDELREKLIKKYGEYFITLKTFKDVIDIVEAGTWITDGGFSLKTPFGHKNRVLINLWH